MSFSNTFETHVLNYVFTSTSVTRPTAWYSALFTSNPDEDASGTEVSTSGTAYARQSATFTVSGNTASNSAAIEFAAATGSWGSISHFGVFDSAASGNLLIHGAFSSAKTIENGDVLKISTGDLDITAA